jgi:uncharacterized membrane-anchored protein
MTLRHHHYRGNTDGDHRLNGWKLVVALAVIAVTAIVTLIITGLPEAVIVVVGPLLLVLGVRASTD